MRIPDAKASGIFLDLLLKGHAIGALFHGRVGLMGANHDLFQRTVGLSVAMVSALGDGALNALVGLAAIAILHWISLHFI